MIIPPEGPDVGKEAKECVLNDDECPLAILLQHPPSKGTLFHFFAYFLKNKLFFVFSFIVCYTQSVRQHSFLVILL